MEHNDYKIHHDDYFSLWTGNGGTIVGAGFNDETRNPMPYNLDNGMFAVARLDQPIETFRWHIIVLHSKTWLQAGDRVVEELRRSESCSGTISPAH